MTEQIDDDYCAGPVRQFGAHGVDAHHSDGHKADDCRQSREGYRQRYGLKHALERAQLPETKAKLRDETAAAIGFEIFGAPSFIARGELFWGHDRLEDALRWVRGEVASSTASGDE